MKTFIKLRVMISIHKDWARKPAELEKKYDGQFQVVFAVIHKLIEVGEKPTRDIGFIARGRKAAYLTSGKPGISSGKTCPHRAAIGPDI